MCTLPKHTGFYFDDWEIVYASEARAAQYIHEYTLAMEPYHEAEEIALALEELEHVQIDECGLVWGPE